MQLSEVVVDIVLPEEERRFRALLDRHHYLGAAPKIGETIWYVARGRRRWLALLAFSSAALKCRARDAWIGWDYPQQYNRLHLLTNNVRYLILPGRHPAHLGSRVLGLCARRLGRDWQARFGHPLLLLETFVDPARFRGTVYRAANWQLVGKTRGFRRDGGGYREGSTPKQVFLRPLARDARQQLSRARLDPALQHGVRTAMITAEQMRSLPAFFREIDDPRTRRGRRHTLSSVLALATAATLCGMRGYKAMSEWVNDLSPQVLIRFRVRRRGGVPQRPSRSTLRDVLTRVDPAQLDQALRRWHEAHGGEDAALSIDGKTLRGAIAADGSQAHVMSVVGHDSKATYAQKKVGLKPGADDETRRTNEIGTVIPLLDMLPDIAAKTFTADAMLTQRKLAEYLRDRRAHFVFTVKENQPTLYGDILLHFDTGAARAPDFEEKANLAHGRIEQRAIWTTSELNGYLSFPRVGQAFMIRRLRTDKRTGKASTEIAYGITSHAPDSASAAQILHWNRSHWCIENAAHFCLDWSWDEDRSRIRTGYGPENTTRLRRFAIGLIKARGLEVAPTLRRLNRNIRVVLDFLKLTRNSLPTPEPAGAPAT